MSIWSLCINTSKWVLQVEEAAVNTERLSKDLAASELGNAGLCERANRLERDNASLRRSVQQVFNALI